ncbi:MAG: DnaJ domain-containing protein [Thermomicrobia bacterium]|nr:DnaJ domain-containing protein [Thermomicrobia bacterium]
MAQTRRDYYEVLAVERGANGDEIKRSYRRLARQYHPDINGEPGAEERFKEINEAYEVLSDDEKRATYDRFGHAGLNGGAGGGNPFGGFDFSDIFDSFFGGRSSASPSAPMRGDDLRAAVDLTFAAPSHAGPAGVRAVSARRRTSPSPFLQG